MSSCMEESSGLDQNSSMDRSNPNSNELREGIPPIIQSNVDQHQEQPPREFPIAGEEYETKIENEPKEDATACDSESIHAKIETNEDKTIEQTNGEEQQQVDIDNGASRIVAPSPVLPSDVSPFGLSGVSSILSQPFPPSMLMQMTPEQIERERQQLQQQVQISQQIVQAQQQQTAHFQNLLHQQRTQNLMIQQQHQQAMQLGFTNQTPFTQSSFNWSMGGQGFTGAGFHQTFPQIGQQFPMRRLSEPLCTPFQSPFQSHIAVARAIDTPQPSGGQPSAIATVVQPVQAHAIQKRTRSESATRTEEAHTPTGTPPAESWRQDEIQLQPPPEYRLPGEEELRQVESEQKKGETSADTGVIHAKVEPEDETMEHSNGNVQAQVDIANGEEPPAAASGVSHPMEIDVSNLSADQLRDEIQRMMQSTQQLQRQYEHIKKSCQEIHSMVNTAVSAPESEAPPPQIVFSVQQIIDETLARDAQLQEIGVTIDTDPGATVKPTPRPIHSGDPVSQLASIHVSAAEAAQLSRVRGRQRGRPVPPLKRKRTSSTSQTRATKEEMSENGLLNAPLGTEASSSDLDQDSAVIASLSALANPHMHSQSMPIDRKSVMHAISRPRKDATEHTYGTRPSNKAVKFRLSPSPDATTDSDPEYEKRPREHPLAHPTEPQVVDGDDSEEYEFEAEEEDLSDEAELDEADDDDFKIRSRPRARKSSESRSPTSGPIKKRTAAPGHHAMTNVSDRISRYPLVTIFVKVQRQWTDSKQEARKLSPSERTELVLVPIRFMVMKPEYREKRGGPLTSNDIFVIAKDVSLLIHKRKGSVAKSIYHFEGLKRNTIGARNGLAEIFLQIFSRSAVCIAYVVDSEKVRVVVCSRPRESGRGSGVVGGGGSISGGGASTTGLSTQVLTVLSYKGAMRLMQHSRSSLATYVQKWVHQQYTSIISNENLLKEHLSRSTRMDAQKHLAPAQQRAEEARMLRMEEEEEMDVQEGFEHLAQGTSETYSEDEDDDSPQSEQVKQDFIQEGEGGFESHAGDISEANADQLAAAAIEAANIPFDQPLLPQPAPKKPRARPKPKPRRRNRPAGLGAATSSQPRPKRVKREPKPPPPAEASGDVRMEQEGEKEPQVDEHQPDWTQEATESDAHSFVPSEIPTPRSSVASSSSRHSRRRFCDVDSRHLFGVELPPDPNVYQAQVVPQQQETPLPIAYGLPHQRVQTSSYPYTNQSPYISVPVPSQLSTVTNDISALHRPFFPLPSSGYGNFVPPFPQPMHHHHLTMAQQLQMFAPHSRAPPSFVSMASSTISPTKQMDTFREATQSNLQVTIEMKSSENKLPDQQNTPTHIHSTTTSPLFTTMPHPTTEKDTSVEMSLEPNQATTNQPTI